VLPLQWSIFTVILTTSEVANIQKSFSQPILFAYEMKWKNKTVADPREWVDAYKDNSERKVVSPANALAFLGIE
jgi:hypothetical protein